MIGIIIKSIELVCDYYSFVLNNKTVYLAIHTFVVAQQLFCSVHSDMGSNPSMSKFFFVQTIFLKTQ